MDADQLSFDDGLKKLEASVKKLEGGTLSLEEALLCFEEGTRLATDLHDKLEDAKRRVEVLRQGKGGECVASPMDGAKE